MQKHAIIIGAVVVALLVGLMLGKHMGYDKQGTYDRMKDGQDYQQDEMMNGDMIEATVGAIEALRYQPAEGVAIEDVLAMDARVKEEFVTKQPGYISRYTTVAEDGTVNIFVQWASLEDVKASQAKAMEDPLMGEYIAMMNMDTLSITEYPVSQ